MQKLTTLFKASPIMAVVVGLMVAGVASAALLTLYGTMTGTANVEQSVVFGNGDTEKEYTIGNSPATAGNTYTEDYNLLNRSVTTAPIMLVTNQCKVGDGTCNGSGNTEEGIDTSYWSTMVLENKNTDTWQAITGDDIQGILTYELVSSSFNYEFEASGLTPEEEYSLVYYADKQDRFVNWGGDNPGALIATAVADADGNVSIEGSQNLAMNLPHTDDWNGTADANYCDNNNGFDDYDLCRGAKIWLVPSSDYNAVEKTVSWANFGSYLYETDLITYDDSDTDGIALYLGEGMLNLFVKNVLDIALEPGDYTVKTQIQPVPVQ